MQDGEHHVEPETRHHRSLGFVSGRRTGPGALDRNHRVARRIRRQEGVAARAARSRRRRPRLLDYFGGGKRHRRPIRERPAAILLDADRDRFVLVRSMCLKIDAADVTDTSCSPDRPPKMMPIRSFFTKR